MAVDEAWWQRAAIYHIYPLSFADSDGDGVGDLAGITSRLGYLAGEPDSLGVDAIWLSPIFRSPMVDFGYDIADHCDIDPRFGTLADAETLIEQAHHHGLRVLFDFVPNHTSDQHAWFVDALSGPAAEHRDCYVWADPAAGGGPPNNWRSAFAKVGSAWTLDEASGQYYLHSYTPEQPDLNWRNPAVRAAMRDVLRFWLARGVDGFRVDAPHRIAKDPELRDNPPDVVNVLLSTQLDDRRHRNIDHEDVHELIRGLRSVLDEYPDRVLIGEVGVRHPVRRMAYHGSAGDEFQLIFDFGYLDTGWDAKSFRALGERLDRQPDPRRWPTHVLSNHDLSRSATRFSGPGAGIDQVLARARAAAVLLLTLPGTAFVYYGEEIGMTDVPVPAEQAADPDGRDPYRTPMQWSDSFAGGFTTGRPWLPVPAAPALSKVNVAAQEGDPSSLLSLYRRLIALRAAEPRLTGGDYQGVAAAEQVYAFTRRTGSGGLLVAINFSGEPVIARLPAAELGTAPGRLVLSTGSRAAGTAVVLGELVLEPAEAAIIELD